MTDACRGRGELIAKYPADATKEMVKIGTLVLGSSTKLTFLGKLRTSYTTFPPYL